LGVAVDLVDSQRGYAAVSLLRPSCEELLWLRYFNTLAASDSSELAHCLIDVGLLKDLEAQAGEIGAKEMKAMGLSAALALFRSKKRSIRKGLKDLGRRLSWPPNNVRQGELPSAWFVAKATNSDRLYRFLYHATSRYVHFSAVELSRRGWGSPGHLELSSEEYEPIWALFSLSWGTRLFGWTLHAGMKALKAEGIADPPDEQLQSAFDAIQSVPLIPLVTVEELLWPSS
jgi:hypothetical protein